MRLRVDSKRAMPYSPSLMAVTRLTESLSVPKPDDAGGGEALNHQPADADPDHRPGHLGRRQPLRPRIPASTATPPRSITTAVEGRRKFHGGSLPPLTTKRVGQISSLRQSHQPATAGSVPTVAS